MENVVIEQLVYRKCQRKLACYNVREVVKYHSPHCCDLAIKGSFGVYLFFMCSYPCFLNLIITSSACRWRQQALLVAVHRKWGVATSDYSLLILDQFHKYRTKKQTLGNRVQVWKILDFNGKITIVIMRGDGHLFTCSTILCFNAVKTDKYLVIYCTYLSRVRVDVDTSKWGNCHTNDTDPKSSVVRARRVSVMFGATSPLHSHQRARFLLEDLKKTNINVIFCSLNWQCNKRTTLMTSGILPTFQTEIREWSCRSAF